MNVDYMSYFYLNLALPVFNFSFQCLHVSNETDSFGSWRYFQGLLLKIFTRLRLINQDHSYKILHNRSNMLDSKFSKNQRLGHDFVWGGGFYEIFLFISLSGIVLIANLHYSNS